MSVVLLIILSLAASSAWAAFNIKQVAQGIYVHQGLIELPDVHNHDAIANIGFIVGKTCVAVIDSGGSPLQGKQLKQSVKKNNKVTIM